MGPTRAITVVVPIYNERENILHLWDRLTASLTALKLEFWEVIFVNDGSNDGSRDILRLLAKQHQPCRTLEFANNQGQSAALAAGFQHARGEVVVTIDGDLQNDPADISGLLEALKPGVGCVAGYRMERHDHWVRRLSSVIANRTRNWLSDEEIRDTCCGLKIFRKSCLDRIKMFKGMHRFLPTLVKLEGYRVVEVPVSHHPRRAGKSKYGIHNRLYASLIDLLAVRWMKKRRLALQAREPKEEDL